jgi:hypothetical protein
MTKKQIKKVQNEIDTLYLFISRNLKKDYPKLNRLIELELLLEAECNK